MGLVQPRGFSRNKPGRVRGIRVSGIPDSSQNWRAKDQLGGGTGEKHHYHRVEGPHPRDPFVWKLGDPGKDLDWENWAAGIKGNKGRTCKPREVS